MYPSGVRFRAGTAAGVGPPPASGHPVVPPIGEREMLLRPPHPGGGALFDVLGAQAVGAATLLMVVGSTGVQAA